MLMARPRSAPPAVIAGKVHAAGRHRPADTCLLWPGELLQEGRPVLRVSGRPVEIRRLLWAGSMRRKMPEGYGVIARCGNWRCVAVKHLALWPVPRIASRYEREDKRGRILPELCQRGHDLRDPMIALWSGGKRRCRLCVKDRMRDRRSKAGLTVPEHRRGADDRYLVCRRGHPLIEGNVLFEKRGTVRRCKTCTYARQRAARAVSIVRVN